jgi:excisionase family DNA binding protein
VGWGLTGSRDRGAWQPRVTHSRTSELSLLRSAGSRSRSEAADALGVSVDFLEEHVMDELRIVRRGRRRLIPVRELERWLEENASRVLDEHARLGRRR